VTVGERFTSNLPRIAGSDLREARACAASAAAEGGEAKDAAIAAMGGMAEFTIKWESVMVRRLKKI
jgi:hypothetical protein